MKVLFLTIVVVSLVLIQDHGFAQNQPTKIPPNVSAPTNVNPPGVTITTQVPAMRVEHSRPASNSALTPPTSLTVSPTEVGSLTAKEILAANSQAVAHVATMYQYFGLFITIIVSLIGIGVGGAGWFAWKSLKEFKEDWNKQFLEEKGRMKDALEKEIEKHTLRINEAAASAEESARKAALDAQSVEDNKIILNEALKDVDKIKQKLAGTRTSVETEFEIETSPPSKGPTQVTEPVDSSETEEDVKVATRLKGKIKPENGEA